MQRARTWTRTEGATFQSSSSQKAGCNQRQISPSEQMTMVSILIQPEGRMQRAGHCPAGGPSSFNPHPARRPDATSKSVSFSRITPRFQSSSSQKVGCNCPPPFLAPFMKLFQSSSSQKAGCNPPSGGAVWRDVMFQSSSSQKAGCNSQARDYIEAHKLFQSSSSQKAGCNPGIQGFTLRFVPCFNPHPARRPDAT